MHDLGVHEALGEEDVELEGAHVHVRALLPGLAVGPLLRLAPGAPRPRRAHHQALLRRDRKSNHQRGQRIELTRGGVCAGERIRTWRLLGPCRAGAGEWSASRGGSGMRVTAMEADHESDDAPREGDRDCRGGSVAVAGWSEAMLALECQNGEGGGRSAGRKGGRGVRFFFAAEISSPEAVLSSMQAGALRCIGFFIFRG